MNFTQGGRPASEIVVPRSGVRGLVKEGDCLLAILHAELLHHRRDVRAYTARLELEPLGDVARRESFRQTGEDVPLSARKAWPEFRPDLGRAETRVAGMELHDHASHQRRGNRRLSVGDLAQRLWQGLEVDVLEEV